MRDAPSCDSDVSASPSATNAGGVAAWARNRQRAAPAVTLQSPDPCSSTRTPTPLAVRSSPDAWIDARSVAVPNAGSNHASTSTSPPSARTRRRSEGRSPPTSTSSTTSRPPSTRQTVSSTSDDSWYRRDAMVACPAGVSENRPPRCCSMMESSIGSESIRGQHNHAMLPAGSTSAAVRPFARSAWSPIACCTPPQSIAPPRPRQAARGWSARCWRFCPPSSGPTRSRRSCRGASGRESTDHLATGS